MKTTIKKAALALTAVSLLMAQPVHSSGIPTFDGAAAANALQQLLNWQARFQSLIRNGLTQIPGVKQFLDAQQEGQIENMFQRREQQCTRLSKNNASSADLCLNTVRLERQKYQLLKRMNTEITAEFSRINGMISAQGKLASSAAGVGPIAGAGVSSGKAESAEQDIQAQLLALTHTIKHYEGQLAQLDMTINQLKWARKQLTKNQLAGNANLANAITNTTGGLWLQQEAQRINTNAKRKRGDNTRISNRF